nr:hypothetical protein [Tanacetum cinerariifolium]
MIKEALSNVHIEAWHTAPTPPSPSPSLLLPLSLHLPRIPSPPLPSSPILRDSILKDDLLPRKRGRSSHRFEIGESSAAAAARQPGSTLAQGTRFGFVAALEEANKRVTDLTTSPRHDSHDMHVRHQDAQVDMAMLKARVASLECEERYLYTSAVTIDERTRLMRRVRNLDDARELSVMMDRQMLLKILIEIVEIVSVRNKMHKAFPLPVMEFPLSEEVPTASEESSHCQKKRDATAVKIRTATKVKK